MSDITYIDAAGLASRGPHAVPVRQQYQPASINEVNRPNRQGHTEPVAFHYTSEELRIEPEDAEFVYNFPKGIVNLVILIINSQFDNETSRDYAQEDFEKMQNIFDHLGFEIRPMRNLTTRELRDSLRNVSREAILQHIGCLACVISSHGSEEAIAKGEQDEYLPDHVTVYEHFISTKDGQIRTKSILEIFDDFHCHRLQGKPKLFFIQACRSRIDVTDPESRNKAFDKGITVETTVENIPGEQTWQHNQNSLRGQIPSGQSHSRMDAAHTMPKKIANEKGIEFYEHTTPDLPRAILAPPVCLNHFLVMFASMPEKVAWSDRRGGWLLDSLHDIFSEKIRRKQPFSLMPALLEVNRMVTSRQSHTTENRFKDMKSMPCMEHKLTKEIILEPKPMMVNMY